jgi:hypothetical protein
MSHYLCRLGRFSFRHRWTVLVTWLLVLIGVAPPVSDWVGNRPTTSQFRAPNRNARSSFSN